MFRFVASVVLDSMNARRILREICSNDDDCGCPSLYLFCVSFCSNVLSTRTMETLIADISSTFKTKIASKASIYIGKNK